MLSRHKSLISETVTRFYLSECVLALHSLHKIGYAHLDLQPENVLLDRFGHVRLVDMGAAEKMDQEGT